MITGSCNCGAIKYQISGTIKKIVNCHCNLCRKMNGSAFSTYAAVLQSGFELISGQLGCFKVSENARKYFCNQCVTPIYNMSSNYTGLNIVHLGSLDCAEILEPEVNIYDESKLQWLTDIGQLPTFEKSIK
ncbi:hypothetical protein GCM10007938_03210 [Vibrio zhanjiangensis]|uniref:CENP-V/GFA domain-containing protein n=2 Tax=Vibrio zhanjiangensis TaxID=1046128 RepID=A0ABQ6EVH0_9VIBR|nr:GFA family protein [Vibrio zhanjiangensis]GLT16545.1 hypothetical protein GCM10007938_03210 [Vibrio zhanjiangensis]